MAYSSTAILVVDHIPVAHTMDSRHELFEYLFDFYGPFYEADSLYSGREDINTAEELRERFDLHAGIEALIFDVRYMDGRQLEAYVLTDPWYIYEVDDADEVYAIREYCEANGIEMENQD